MHGEPVFGTVRGMPENRILASYDTFLLDLDGVLVRGTVPIPGAAEAFKRLRRSGEVFLLTNNSTRSREQHAQQLSDLGFPSEAENIVASGFVAARHLLNEYGPVTVWPLGESGLREELAAAGHHIATLPEEADWVVAGMDRALDYDGLAQALRALLSGARLLATNLDGTYPTADGLQPGAGAVVGALRGMGFPPEIVVGKPAAIAYEAALQRTIAPRDRVLMIGDRLETDIAGALTVGIDTALVLTGVSSRQEIDKLGVRPTWIAEDFAALVRGDAIRPEEG